jgi:hypothetical protein
MPQEILQMIFVLVANSEKLRSFLNSQVTLESAFEHLQNTVVQNLANGDCFTKYHAREILHQQLERQFTRVAVQYTTNQSSGWHGAPRTVSVISRCCFRKLSMSKHFEETEELRLNFMTNLDFSRYEPSVKSKSRLGKLHGTVTSYLYFGTSR